MYLYYVETFMEDCGKYHNIVPGVRFFSTLEKAEELATDWVINDDMKHIEIGAVTIYEAVQKYPRSFGLFVDGFIYDYFTEPIRLKIEKFFN